MIGALIEQALAELAELIGADRAYLMIASRPARVYRWCREETPFPLGWPDRVPGLLTFFGPSPEGSIHVPFVDRLPVCIPHLSGIQHAHLREV